jgi:hypothetical protein
MSQTAPLAVVSTQLALTDRRALSQAWYSALRLAVPQRDGALARRRGPAVAPRRALGRLAAPLAHALALRTGEPPVVRARTLPAVRAGNAPERRAPPSELARRIRRALTRRVLRGLPASFAVRAGNGRVHLLVRRDGTCTRVVAVCVAPLRARVERALAQARFALAARGVHCEAER